MLWTPPPPPPPPPSLDGHGCRVCGRFGSFGFGPPGGSVHAAAWFCGGHRADGEAWRAAFVATPSPPALPTPRLSIPAASSPPQGSLF